MKFILISDTHYNFAYKAILNRFYKDIATKDFDAIIHAGDWAGRSDEEIDVAFAQIRKFIKKPIFTVFGNHDFWCERQTSYSYRHHKEQIEIDEIFYKQRQFCNKHEIILLNQIPTVFQDINLFGFDGWYWHSNVNTNDIDRLPPNAFKRLQTKANIDLDSILKNNVDKNKTIAVTHFSMINIYNDDLRSSSYMGANPNYLNYLTDFCKILCVGHTHRYYDIQQNGCRIIDTGSDYGNPKSLEIEL
jgi:predicted phosphodiesterase